MAIVVLTYSDVDGLHSINLDRETTSIGRSPGQDVVLRHPCVSRQHALIVRDGDSYTVIDQNSTHGTYLNSVRIARSILKIEDALQMGSLNGPQLRFHLERDDETVSGVLEPQVTSLLSSLSELRTPAGKLRPAAREMEKLSWLLRAARQLSEGGAIEDILSAFLHLTLQLTGLERGFVFLREDGEMCLAQGLGADGKITEEDSTLSRRAMQKAIESEAKFSISDTLSDEKAAGWSSVLANRIRSSTVFHCASGSLRTSRVSCSGCSISIARLDLENSPRSITNYSIRLQRRPPHYYTTRYSLKQKPRRARRGKSLLSRQKFTIA
ncbi:FHA domain-containing protein [Granulicella sp. L60]|uniref:FHA domain-containing protein n=1 Tax=Granulicella sp. L60 TaxID=1641866 RepID=UPI0020B146F7|nr:FHA domain-containing protein [Granulicella sp. L60]